MLPNKKPLKLSHKMSNKQTREASVKEKKTVRDKRKKETKTNREITPNGREILNSRKDPLKSIFFSAPTKSLIILDFE